MMDFKKKEIIGMIHLAGPNVIEKALDEIKIYEEEGLSGIIIENYHGSVADVISVLNALKEQPTTLSVGINILPNEFELAFDICSKYQFIEFIQLDYIGGEYQNGPDKTLKLDFERFIMTQLLKHDLKHIKVFGGVWPKYYLPIEGSRLGMDITEALFFSDAIVVTGSGTGQETPLDKIKTFRGIMNNDDKKTKLRGDLMPLIVGAGLTALNVREALETAQGGIVGSAFKPEGRTNRFVDRSLVKEFMDIVKEINNVAI